MRVNILGVCYLEKPQFVQSVLNLLAHVGVAGVDVVSQEGFASDVYFVNTIPSHDPIVQREQAFGHTQNALPFVCFTDIVKVIQLINKAKTENNGLSVSEILDLLDLVELTKEETLKILES